MKKNGLNRNSIFSVKAFTLIEIVLVVAIVGVLLMLLLDFLDSSGGFVKPDTSIEDLEFQIRFASDFVSGEVFEASELMIGNAPPTDAQGYNRIEVIDNQVIYTPVTGEPMDLTDAIIMNSETDAVFSVSKDTLSNQYTLVYKLVGTSGVNVFPLESSVVLKNLGTSSTSTGQMIFYKKAATPVTAVTTTSMGIVSETTTVTITSPEVTLITVPTETTATTTETTATPTTQTTTEKVTKTAKVTTTAKVTKTDKVTTTAKPTTTKKPTPTTTTTTVATTTAKPAPAPYSITVSVNNESLSYFSNNTTVYRNQGDNAIVTMTVTGATLISDNPQTVKISEPKSFSVRLSNGEVVKYTFYAN